MSDGTNSLSGKENWLPLATNLRCFAAVDVMRVQHPSLTRVQIEQIFHKLNDPVWLVNALNKQEGFEIPQYQWPFKVAGEELEQSKYLWEEILESITQCLTSGDDQFELFEGFMEEVEESPGLSDEVISFIQSDPYLHSLARACGWEYLEGALES